MNIQDLYYEHNISSDTTLVFLQGGVRNDLVTDLSIELANKTKESYYYLITVRFFKKWFCRKVNFVQPKQFQHLNPDFTINNIDDAKRYNEQNLNNLHQVILHLKAQGKRVILMGQSYGSFLGLKYIAKYGTHHLDKIILGHGRLYTPTFLTFSIINLKSWVFFNRQGEIASIEKFNDITNSKLIFAEIMQQDYTELLKDVKDLWKLHYFASQWDNIVGNISNYEKEFLKQRGAHLTLYSTRVITWLYWLTFKKINPGRIGHHAIFGPWTWFKMSKLINHGAKKIPVVFLKHSKLHKKTWNKVKNIKKQNAAHKIKFYQRYKAATQEESWQNISRQMIIYTNVLKSTKPDSQANKEKREQAIGQMKKLNKEREKLYKFLN